MTFSGVSMLIQLNKSVVVCGSVLQRRHSGDGCLSSSILFKYERSRGHLFVLSWTRVRRVALESVDDQFQGLQTTQPTSGGAVTADSSCCANCVEPPRPQQWGPDLPFFGHAGHADPLDGWRCYSQKPVMSRPIQVRQL